MKKRRASVISDAIDVCNLGILAIFSFYGERISGRHSTNSSHFAGRFYLERGSMELHRQAEEFKARGVALLKESKNSCGSGKRRSI
ncbi:MAG: hypothetical protein ACXQTS_02315 [Candidatus Methanospirareceae archaeon]